MSDVIKRLANNAGDPRTIAALFGMLNILFPSGKDTELVAHDGGGQADALQLNSTTAWHEVITVASGDDSVVLPRAKVGEIHFVRNSAGANAMQVFGITPDTINSIATGTGVSQAAGTGVLYVCLVDGNYVTF